MKAIGEDGVRRMLDATSTGNGSLIFIAAGEPDSTSKLLGQLRLILAKKDGLLKPDEYAFTWVVDFPLLEWDAEEKRYNSMHHPFTSPHDEDMGKLDTDPGQVRAQGVRPRAERQRDRRRQHSNPRLAHAEAGSSRCSTSALRRRSCASASSSRRSNTGTPPHGGIALGLDRMTAILSNESSIREVIAFRRPRRPST
jgi:aspartyl-tRNA synthetase